MLTALLHMEPPDQKNDRDNNNNNSSDDIDDSKYAKHCSKHLTCDISIFTRVSKAVTIIIPV